jgi:hypothetical protein
VTRETSCLGCARCVRERGSWAAPPARNFPRHPEVRGAAAPRRMGRRPSRLGGFAASHLRVTEIILHFFHPAKLHPSRGASLLPLPVGERAGVRGFVPSQSPEPPHPTASRSTSPRRGEVKRAYAARSLFASSSQPPSFSRRVFAPEVFQTSPVKKRGRRRAGWRTVRSLHASLRTRGALRRAVRRLYGPGPRSPRTGAFPPAAASSSRSGRIARRHSSLHLRKLRRLVCAVPGRSRTRLCSAASASAGPNPTSRRNRFASLMGSGMTVGILS